MHRIIVIDEDRAAVDMLSRLLRLDGWDVAGFTSPVAGRAAMEMEPFDAVVTELEMREVPGVEIVRAAQRVKHAAPVFAVSAYAGTTVTQGALTSGARRVFAKPLDYDALCRALSETLGR